MSEPKQPDTTETLFNRLEPHIRRVGHGSLKHDGPFRCIVRAAIVKAFEFTVYSQGKRPEPFFLTATLRGLCEDLIVLTFLAPLADRDDIVVAINDDNLSESLERQDAFFQANRSWQPVVRNAPGKRQSAVDKLKNIARIHGWNRNRLPTVRDMAQSCGLAPIYEFMYSATSKWVHCSPHVLLRMGWSKSESKDEVSHETQWSFSASHFDRYYDEFNRIYSTFLLLLIVKSFLSEFDQPGEVEELVRLLDDESRDVLRWPELVTYEELNLDAPGVLQRILMRAQLETKDGEGAVHDLDSIIPG